IATNPQNAITGNDRGPAQPKAGPGKRTPVCVMRTRDARDAGWIGESGRMGAPHAMPKADEPAAIDVGSVEAATGRLIAALDALEAAAERRRDADRGVQSLAAQIQ